MPRYLHIISIYVLFFMMPLITLPDEKINGIIIDSSSNSKQSTNGLEGYRYTASQETSSIPEVPAAMPATTAATASSAGGNNTNQSIPEFVGDFTSPEFQAWHKYFEPDTPRFKHYLPPTTLSQPQLNFAEAIQQPQKKQTSHNSAQFEQFAADTRSFHRKLKQHDQAQRNHMILGMLTPPAEWLRQQKEMGFADVVLLSQLEYWQIDRYRTMLEKMPAFPFLIFQLADEIRRNPDFMKDSVPGLRYESHNKKYWQDTLGDGIWGTMLGNIASLKSHPDDHSKFQRMVLDYNKKFTTQNATYNNTLQQNKETMLRTIEPQADPDDPFDSDEHYTPFPAEVVLPEFDDPQALCDLADQYRGLSGVIPHTPELLPYRDLILDRATALNAAAPSSYISKDYRVTIDRSLLQQHPELEYVANFSGNLAQLRLHSELATQINNAGAFAKANHHNVLATNTPLVYALSNAAAAQDNPTAAFHIADACFNINHLTTMLDAVLPQNIKIVGSGVAQGMVATANHMHQLITHPINTTINGIVQTGQLISNSLSAAYALTLGSHEEAAAVWNKLEQMGNHLYDNPDQAVAFITQMLIPAPGVMALANAKRLNMLGKLSHVIKKEMAVSHVIAAAGAGGEMMSFAMQPVIQSVKTMQKTAARAQQVTGKAGENITIIRGTLIPVKADAVINAHGKRMPGINWRHAYKHEFNKRGGLTGGHSEFKKDFSVVPGTHRDNNTLGFPQAPGFYYQEVTEPVTGLIKGSSFFPKNWSKSMIRKKLREAYKDGANNLHNQPNPLGLVGHTSEGVPIQFWFSKSSHNGKEVFMIKSFYPKMKP